MTRWIYPGADLNATAFGERARSIVGDIDSLVKARHGTSSSERNEEVERAAEERPFRPVPADKKLESRKSGKGGREEITRAEAIDGEERGREKEARKKKGIGG